MVDALISAGGPAVLIYETLAERTLHSRTWPSDKTPPPVMSHCSNRCWARCRALLRGGVKIVSNFGAANPRGAALRIRAMAEALGLPAPRIAVIAGDDVSGPAHRAVLQSELGSALDGRTWSAPTRISAPSRSPPR